MLLGEFFYQFKKYWKQLLLGIALCGLGGALWANFFEAPYQALLSLDVVQSGSQTVDDYKYDGYYSLLAADEFSKTIQFWLKSPRVVSDIFSKANLPLSAGSGGLDKFFGVKKLSAQYLEIEYGADSEVQAQNLARGLREVLGEKITQITGRSQEKVSFTLQIDEPLVWYAKKGNVIKMFGLGLFLGVILGAIFLLLLSEPTKPKKVN